MADILEWSPHPLKRPGHLLVGLLHLLVGSLFLLDALWLQRVLPGGWLGPLVAFLIALVVAATFFIPRGNRKGPGRIAIVLIVVLSGLALHLGLSVGRDPPPAGLPYGGVLFLVGVLIVAISESRRRQVRITLDDKGVSVFVRRYRLEHTLPLEGVKEMNAARSLWGRTFGYGDFVARVRKGTMQDRVTKPLVGEDPPEAARRGNGWDEEERYHLVAAHPYRKVRRELENRILLAKMPPKEREEAMLADRLAEDLDGVRV